MEPYSNQSENSFVNDHDIESTNYHGEEEQQNHGSPHFKNIHDRDIDEDAINDDLGHGSSNRHSNYHHYSQNHSYSYDQIGHLSASRMLRRASSRMSAIDFADLSGADD